MCVFVDLRYVPVSNTNEYVCLPGCYLTRCGKCVCVFWTSNLFPYICYPSFQNLHSMSTEPALFVGLQPGHEGKGSRVQPADVGGFEQAGRAVQDPYG